MTYYLDLSPYEYSPALDQAYNVGWLDENYPFPTGTTSTGFRERLLAHCHPQFTVHHYLGIHTCQFCPTPEPQVKVPWGDEQISLGNGEIRVIGTDTVYAAPTLVYHYVVDHDYLPPEEFVEAVLAGPGPGTDEHRILLGMIEGEYRAPDLPPEVKRWLLHHGGETEELLAPDQLAQFLDAARAGHSLTLDQLAELLRAYGPELEADTISELLANTHLKRRRARRAIERSLDEYSFGQVASLDQLVQIYQDLVLGEAEPERRRTMIATCILGGVQEGSWNLRAPLPYFLKEYARAEREA